ncbi:hypothetical protein C8R45DRAFT_1105075 [Mycena sanguinolenta]|nr:hypothetical protein C8R45DRAFT_1105075 [Mycena sanguinolenta]
MPLRPKKDSAARARAAKAPRKVPVALSSESDSPELDNCHWDGTKSDKIPQFFEPFTEPGAVNSGSAIEWACEDGQLQTDDELSDPDRDIEGADLLSFVLSGENDNASISTVYKIITEHKSEINWSAAESKLKGPHTGNSDRTQRRNDQKLHEKEERDKVLRASASARAFTNIFRVVPRTMPSSNAALAEPSQPLLALSTLSPAVQINNATLPPPFPDNKIFTGYLSDISSGDLSDAVAPEMSVAGAVPSPISTAIDTPATSSDMLIPHQVRPPPALKHRKFAVPQEEHRRAGAILAIAARANILASSLTAINKLIASKKDVFHAGNASLQSSWAWSIQSHLHMVVKNQKGWKLASETAAEAQGFATKWGGVSKIGKHGKSYSLYNDPIIRAELRSYIRSEKWAMDPAKLVEFSEQKMLPAAADKYLRKITEEEMPAGLKKYMEVELFPRMAFKVGRGVSLRTACRLLQRCPDVVDDRQNRFLPAMAGHCVRLVEYKVGDVDTELEKMYDGKYVWRRLVLCSHDEMTAQCNDGPLKTWVLESEQPLRKKGVGRGLHHSDPLWDILPTPERS